MQQLKTIDRQIIKSTVILRSQKLIDDVYSNLKTNCIDFDLKSNDLRGKLEEIGNIPGVYLFWIKNTRKNQNVTDWFSKIWITDNIKDFQHSPRIIKKRIGVKYSSLDWIELYLGKTEDLQKRLLDHVYLEGSKRTFALKLNARVSKLKNERFKINWIALEELTEVQIILKILEEEVRKKTMPITGRQ